MAPWRKLSCLSISDATKNNIILASFLCSQIRNWVASMSISHQSNQVCLFPRLYLVQGPLGDGKKFITLIRTVRSLGRDEHPTSGLPTRGYYVAALKKGSCAHFFNVRWKSVR